MNISQDRVKSHSSERMKWLPPCFFSLKKLKKKGGNQCLYFPQTFFRIKVTGFEFRLGLALGLGLGKLEVRVKVTSREGIGELGLWYPNMYIDRGVHSVSSRRGPVYVQ